MELVFILAAPVVAAATLAWLLSRRDRRRWNPSARSVGDGGRAYRNAQAEAGHARDTWTSNAG